MNKQNTIYWLHRRLGLISSLFLLNIGLMAQQNSELDQSTAIWTSVMAKIAISPKIKFALSSQIRATNDLPYNIDRLLIETQLRFNLPKDLEARVGYRWGQRWQNIQHRPWLELNYKPDFSKHWLLKISSVVLGDFIVDKNTEYQWRPQVDLAYKHKNKSRLIPEVGATIFYAFNNYYQTWTRYRLSAGLEYKIAKEHSVSAKYIYQRYINIGIPEINHIWSIDYDFSISFSKKKPIQPADN